MHMDTGLKAITEVSLGLPGASQSVWLDALSDCTLGQSLVPFFSNWLAPRRSDIATQKLTIATDHE